MTSLTGYIQGLGGGERRTVDKTGKEVRLSVFDNIDNVIVFNQEGETKQKTLTGKNLFDKDDSSLLLQGFISLTDNTFIGTATSRTICISVESNTTYTISKIQSERFRVASSPTIPTNATPVNGMISNDTGTSITFTVGASDNYLLAFVYNSNYDTLTPEQILATVQIEKGSTATPYEPYCGGVPSPNPDYPQDIVGIGTKRQDGTYRVDIDYYDEREERDGRITASGLAYPLYEGDILDFANSKVIRANGYLTKAIANMNGDENYPGWTGSGIRALIGSGYNKNFTNPTVYCSVGNNFSVNTSGQSNDTIFLPKATYGGLTQSQWIAQYPDLTVTFVFPLETPTEEDITLSGDISDIGTAVVEADGTLTVKYDKVEMAIRKYSAKPDWQKIGYTDTPQIILDGFDYSKQIYDSWTPAASYASKYRGDKALKFFPEVDITGATNYSAMFQESGILSTPPLTIGDGSNTVIDSRWMFQNSPIEEIELTTSDPAQKVQIMNIFNGCSNLKNAKLTLSASGSMQNAFADCKSLKRIEDGLETSDVTSFSEAFRACSSLLYLYELDLSSCTTCYRAFQNCTSLESAPYLNNIRTGGNFAQMFWNCSSLRILPPYNLGSPSNLTNMFQGTGSNLDEASRINILSMLAACTYSGTKTLAHLGFTASMYSAASWQALPHYNEFVSAGWSIGYS
jgi:hypothetical protein